MGLMYKDPDADLDYGVDWDEYGWLQGDTILNSTWSVSPTGDSGDIVIGDDFIIGGISTTVWLSVGRVGICYEVTNHIITAGVGINQREDDRTLHIMIKEK